MQAIVLSRRNIREADQIISLYSLEKGKVEILAKGIKKIISKNSAHLEPFCFSEVEIISGKELNHLGSNQSLNSFLNIRNNLEKSLAASFVVSLLDKTIEVGEKDERIFILLKSWLEFFDKYDFNLILVDALVIKLLYYLGFDLLSIEKLNLEIKKDLTILLENDWQLINNLKLEKGEYKKIHGLIYKFLVFQTGKKINDWSLLT